MLFCVGALGDEIRSEDGHDLMELILGWGYPVERHYIRTEDGLDLMTLRIPHGREEVEWSPRQAVICQHGLLDSSEAWISNLPNESLAYILADRGMDIWMPNNRGNKYSQPEEDTAASWRFTFDESRCTCVPRC